jgi:plasmid stability protein
MASMTIRNLDDRLKARLRVRAAAHGRSMEDEARDILRSALATGTEAQPTGLGRAIRHRLERIGGIELDVPAREPIRSPGTFAE